MSDDIFGFLARVIDTNARLGRLESYARLLRKVTCPEYVRDKDSGLGFVRRDDIQIPPDMVSTGRHTVMYELDDGSGKLYRIMIEPDKETHR